MSRGEAEEAIQVLDDFKLTNDLFREHLLDLCMNKRAKEAFDKLTTQQKSAFTRAYNKDHKDPTVGKRGKKSAAPDADVVSDSDEEKDMGNIEEDELAEIKRAKQRERDLIQEKAQDKVKNFEMINPVVHGETTKKAKAPAKPKAKTQTGAKKNKKGKDSEEDSLDGFIVADDEDPKPRKKAKTAKGKGKGKKQ